VYVTRWWTGPWQHCSVTCGDQGTRKRTVLCVRQLGPAQQIALEDWECEDLDRPVDMIACPPQEPCLSEPGQWHTGSWSDVSDNQLYMYNCKQVIYTSWLKNTPHEIYMPDTHTHTHTHTHITGERQSRPVLTATSQSNGNGRTSTLTETKPLNRLRKNFAQLIKSTRRTRNPKLEPIGRKGASGEYVKFFINFLFLFFPGLA